MGRLLWGIVAALLVAQFVAAKKSYEPVHGRQHMRRADGWVQMAEADENAMMCMTIAVVQPGLERLQTVLDDVSSPKSRNFRKWLSFDEVGQFAANPKGTEAVVSYLNSIGASSTEVLLRGEYVRACMRVHQAAAMLDAKFYHYEKDGRSVIRATSYVVPSTLRPYVWFITNVNNLPVPQLRHPAYNVRPSSKPTANLCNGVACPQVIAQYYGVPASAQADNHENWVSIFNAVGVDGLQDLLVSDLKTFLQTEQSSFKGPYQIVIEGQNNVTDCSAQAGSGACAESGLDIQTISGLADQLNILWVGLSLNATSDSALYLQFEEILTRFAADIQVRAKEIGFGFVASMSYGVDESSCDPHMVQAFDAEVMKAVAMGCTLIVASGDQGVQGRSSDCDVFEAAFPGAAPHILSIGASMGPESGSPVSTCAYDPNNTSGSSIITSGGGFSTIFSSPSYQTAAVGSYLKALPKLKHHPKGSSFSSSGRGYPDIALLGNNFNVIVDGQGGDYSGTSASAPIAAALLSMINTQLHSAGKAPLGFVHPFLYGLPAKCFLDVTTGGNQCGDYTQTCCGTGFDATTGWDAATGLGGLNFPCVLQAALAQGN